MHVRQPCRNACVHGSNRLERNFAVGQNHNKAAVKKASHCTTALCEGGGGSFASKVVLAGCQQTVRAIGVPF